MTFTGDLQIFEHFLHCLLLEMKSNATSLLYYGLWLLSHQYLIYNFQHENEVDASQGDCSNAKTKGGTTRSLEHFLEETFQLQRYMVATGQKLMEIQSKIASGFSGVELDKTATFDMKRFSDNIKSLFQEVQRGLEVRIARIIGDLEGTLACEGMTHFRR